MRIIHDLTRPIVPGMPVYPGDPAVAFSPAAAIETEGFRVTQVSLGTHAGTHLDAPSHFLVGGGGVEGIPLATLVGPARVFDLAALARDLEIEPGDRILIRSGWSSHWGRGDYFDDFPPLPAHLIETLVAGRAGLIGLENPSLHPDHEIDAAYHNALLGAGIVIVENLVGLATLPDRFELAVLPLPLTGLDGAPCRVVAW